MKIRNNQSFIILTDTHFLHTNTVSPRIYKKAARRRDPETSLNFCITNGVASKTVLFISIEKTSLIRIINISTQQSQPSVLPVWPIVSAAQHILKHYNLIFLLGNKITRKRTFIERGTYKFLDHSRY